ncbi:MAG: sugar ABC transporter substrate-binding protein [Oscillospiraceae bacterium]|nr:sugar ABC transporter substrate-binding protein [Oscillospiraceae bacterium]
MKKAVSVGIASLLLAGSMTGCGQKNVQPGDVAGYDSGETYISMWVHTIEETPEGQAYKESVERFNETFNGTYFADVEFIPRNDSGGGYSDKINASVMSGDLPDVITVDGPNVAAYAANGIIQPLAELTEEERSAYLDSILEQGTYDDQLYALGAMESSVGLYYNKAILQEAGITVPEAGEPWTWSEFIEILEQLQPIMEEKNGYPLDMTFPVGEASIYYYAPFIWSNGGDFVSEDGLTVDSVFNSQENVAAMQYFRSFVDNGYMSQAPIENLFESGRAAFKFDGAWEVNTIYQNYPDIELGVAPYVVSDQWDGGRYTPTGSWAYAATSGTEHIEAATELVKWMSGTDSGVLLFENTKSMPSTYAAYDQITLFEEDENYKALYEQLRDYGHPRPKTPVYPQVSTSFQQTLESVGLSGKDAQEELDKSVERINAKLERYTRK